jgi:spore maturation protein CgeB
MSWPESGAAFRGVGDWHGTMQHLPNYVGRLSTGALSDESVHDRVFFALSAGVPPLSESNAFLRAHAPELEPYCFQFSPEQITEAADRLLSNPAEALARTEATWQAMSPAFSMRRSAQQIVHFVALHAVNARADV